MISSYLLQNKELSTQRFSKSVKPCACCAGRENSSGSRLAGCFTAHHGTGEMNTAAAEKRERKGDRKRRQVKLPWRVIFSQQYLHVLPYALPVYYDCTPHRAGPHHDSDWWPRSTSAGSSTCPGKQVFFPPAFTFLLVFHFFTDTRDLNGKLDIFLLLILPTSILMPAWVSGWPQGKPSWSIWEEIEKETCRVAVWAHGDSH